MKIDRVESREVHPVTDRLHYVINFSKSEANFYKQGRELKDEEIGDHLVCLTNAVNAAERQIEMLLKIINACNLNEGDLEDYLEQYPQEENYAPKYKVEDIKDALFHSMMKKDEKAIGKYLNQLNIVTEKQENERPIQQH